MLVRIYSLRAGKTRGEDDVVVLGMVLLIGGPTSIIACTRARACTATMVPCCGTWHMNMGHALPRARRAVVGLVRWRET